MPGASHIFGGYFFERFPKLLEKELERRHQGKVVEIWAAIFSTQGTFFSELFPPKVRYTGLSVGYQIAAAIVGFGPMIWTSMAKTYGPSPWAFGGFMMAGLALSLILSLFAPETKSLAYSRVRVMDTELSKSI